MGFQRIPNLSYTRMFECFPNLSYKAGDVPESERAEGDILSLPACPELYPQMRERAANPIFAAVRGNPAVC